MRKRRDIVWAAGFLDGEGCLTIRRNIRIKNGKTAIYYQPWIACGMAYTPQNEQAILKLQSLFEGHIMQFRQEGNRRDTITWAVASRLAKLCAEKLEKYLIVKKPQAQIILKFYEECELDKNKKVSLEELQQRSKYYWELRKLNHKGRLRLQRLSEETPKGEATV